MRQITQNSQIFQKLVRDFVNEGYELENEPALRVFSFLAFFVYAKLVYKRIFWFESRQGVTWIIDLLKSNF